MKKTYLSINLLRESIEYHNEMNQYNFVNAISKSIPILFFGNIGNYLKNDFKIVTAAINPSLIEFKDDEGFSLFRFKDFNGTIQSLELSWSNYFQNNPYTAWFGKRIKGKKGFQPVLNGIGYCYYSDRRFKNVLHTDICSPVATFKIWGELSLEEQTILMNKGKLLWIKTIKELKPDLILFSGLEKYLDGFTLLDDDNKTFEIHKIDNRFAFKNLILDDFSTSILIGPNSRFGPYGANGIDGNLRLQIGNLIRKIFNINSFLFDKSEYEINNLIPQAKFKLEKTNYLTKSYFMLKQSYLGKNYIIRFTDKNNNVIEYNHDEILNQLGEKITNLNCWKTRGLYTNSKALPKFAEGLKSIKYLNEI